MSLHIQRKFSNPAMSYKLINWHDIEMEYLIPLPMTLEDMIAWCEKSEIVKGVSYRIIERVERKIYPEN